jgi:hypothetical protein
MPSTPISTISTSPTVDPILRSVVWFIQANGRFTIRTQKVAFSNICYNGELRSSKSLRRKRLPSKTQGLPTRILFLSPTLVNSTKNRFSPKTWNENDPNGFHQHIKVIWIASLLTIRFMTSFPNTQNCPHATPSCNSSSGVSRSKHYSFVKERFIHIFDKSSITISSNTLSFHCLKKVWNTFPSLLGFFFVFFEKKFIIVSFMKDQEQNSYNTGQSLKYP